MPEITRRLPCLINFVDNVKYTIDIKVLQGYDIKVLQGYNKLELTSANQMDCEQCVSTKDMKSPNRNTASTLTNSLEGLDQGLF